MQEKKLQQYGEYFLTDKHDHHHTFAQKSYLDIYEPYFKPLRERKINFLEIGVRDGCSHRMWQQYFSKESNIYGIDIDPRCSVYAKENIKIYIGSQDDLSVIDNVVSDAKDGFDVILDDGSHVNELTINSFNLLFKHVKPGGLYIIEDLACSYLGKELHKSIIEGAWPGMQYNKNVTFNNDRNVLNKLFFDIIRDIDLMQTEEYESVHFYSRIAVIKKQGKNI